MEHDMGATETGRNVVFLFAQVCVCVCVCARACVCARVCSWRSSRRVCSRAVRDCRVCSRPCMSIRNREHNAGKPTRFAVAFRQSRHSDIELSPSAACTGRGWFLLKSECDTTEWHRQHHQHDNFTCGSRGLSDFGDLVDAVGFQEEIVRIACSQMVGKSICGGSE